MSATTIGLLTIVLKFASLRDAEALFGENGWECARAPVRHVDARRCRQPDVAVSADRDRTIAIECSSVGCDAWATNARKQSEPEGTIRVHKADAVWILNVPGGGPLRAKRFPVRLEDASAWFAQPSGSVLALRVALQGYANDDCKAITEFTYIIHFASGRWSEVASGVTGFFGPKLSRSEVEEGYATCPVRATEETHQCAFELRSRAKEEAVMRCGRSTQRIPIRGGRTELSALRPVLRRWWASQGR